MCDICDPHGMKYSYDCVCTVDDLKDRIKQLEDVLKKIPELTGTVSANNTQDALLLREIENIVQKALEGI